MAARFTQSDEGKRVVAPDGEVIGRIVDVREGTARVECLADRSDTVRSRLGSSDGERRYALDTSVVAAISESEIQIRRDL